MERFSSIQGLLSSTLIKQVYPSSKDSSSFTIRQVNCFIGYLGSLLDLLQFILEITHIYKFHLLEHFWRVWFVDGSSVSVTLFLVSLIEYHIQDRSLNLWEFIQLGFFLIGLIHCSNYGWLISQLNLGQGHQLVSSAYNTTCCHTQIKHFLNFSFQARSLASFLDQTITSVTLLEVIESILGTENSFA